MNALAERKAWRKASHSNPTPEGSCVEVRLSRGRAAVRDSKNAAGGLLAFPRGAWFAFLAAQR